jgi:hypothetical protein
VIQTAAAPPNSGNTILPTIGWMRKSSVALVKTAAV